MPSGVAARSATIGSCSITTTWWPAWKRSFAM
jgi:hypothetical protein